MSQKPKPEEIKRLRVYYGFTQKEAADSVHVTIRTWQWWEAGDRQMPLGLWELFVIKTGFHKRFQDVEMSPSKGGKGVT